MELSHRYYRSERDNQYLQVILKNVIVSSTHSYGCVKHINSIQKHFSMLLSIISNVLSSIRSQKKGMLFQQDKFDRRQQKTLKYFEEVADSYDKILNVDDISLLLSELSKKCPIELDGEIAYKSFKFAYFPSFISATIHDILNSPRAQLCARYLSQIVNRLHHHLIDPLSSLSSFTSNFRIKGTVPEEGGKASMEAPLSFILVVLGWSGEKAEKSIEMFDPSARKWSFFQQETPFARAYHGTVLLGNEVYVIGGFNGHICKASTLCLNIRSGEWTRKSSMSSPRCYVTTVAYRGLIYAIGGHNGFNRLKTCEVMEPKKDKWKRIADMMYRRSDSAAAQLNGKIFVSGGFDGFHFHSSVEFYDPAYDDWTLVARLINPRSGHSMVAMDGHIFALGGFNGYQRMREVEQYDEEHKCWYSLTPMLTGRSNFSATVFQDEIFAMGGYDGESTTLSVEKFSRTALEWKIMPGLNVHRSATGACVVGNIGSDFSCSVKEFVPVTSTNIEGPSP